MVGIDTNVQTECNNPPLEQAMFKHILFPTDGSPASSAALHSAIKFAQEAGARVTALHVIPEFHIFTYHPDMLEDTRGVYLKDSEVHSASVLDEVAKVARDYNVPCDAVQRRSDQPYKGVKGMLLGSETHRVLLNTPVPVLVFRPQ
jgi:nucleotide-binding universal stress UspA family protein